MTEPLAAGRTIGILGGGQLGRMLSVAASRLGFKTHIFEPSANPPAGHVADRVTTAPYEDVEALADFAAALAALNALAEIAEEENHHPDLTISDYRCLTVSLTTHDAGGLTANDFVVARRADGVLAGNA